METFTTVFVLLVSIITIKNCHGNCISSNVCKNGGFCDVTQSRCICPPGFAGSKCQTTVKYMLDECSKTIALNTTDTLVLKSQSSTYLPSTANCHLNVWVPSDHKIFVNVIELDIHYNCDHDYLKLDDKTTLCGRSEDHYYRYVLSDSYTSMYLHLSSGSNLDKHLGFIITLSTFIPPENVYWGRWCEFLCRNSRCISSSLYDNGFDDCGDNSDEPAPEYEYCFEYECNGRCIPDKWIGDCNTDCSDGSDEWGYSCPAPLYGRCDIDYFWCESSNSCMRNSVRCNGITDCNSPYDEINCNRLTTPESVDCGHNAFRCPSTCIPKDFVCDSYPDCSDGSDEKYCHMSTGVLTGVVVASLLSVVCFVCATLLLVSIIYKRRQVRIRRNNIRTVSAYIPPEPQNLLTNCEIPPSYEIAVGIDDVKEDDEELKGSSESKDTLSFEDGDALTSHNGTFDDNHELPLMDAISEISKTDPPNKFIQQ